MGEGQAGNNMSNFINGRERLRLPKSSVKDRREGRRCGSDGELGGGGGKEKRECEGKCEREKGEESFGFVVNRCKWVREAGSE